MIVDDFYFFGSGIGPPEAETPPVVDSNTEATGAIALQSLEAVTRWDLQIVKATGNVELSELATGDRGDAREAADATSLRQRFGIRAPERSNH